MSDGKPGRPPERVTVTIHFKMALATPPVVETVVWPRNWPFPEQGDQIWIGELTGIVMNKSFYPAENKLVLNLR